MRDYAEVRADGRVSAETARAALTLFEVDELGLDKVDRAILDALCRTFAGRAVGLGTLAVAVGEAPETVEDVYEPFLMQCGLLERTPRGRIATPAAFAHAGLRARARRPQPVCMTQSSTLVGYEVRDRIAHVTIDNGKANALVARRDRRARRRATRRRRTRARKRSARCCSPRRPACSPAAST